MEFSKKIVNVSWAAFVIVLILRCFQIIDTEIVLGVLAECGVATGFYYWKSKNENRSKYAQKYMKLWAEKYGPEAAARIAEIVLRD